MISEVRKQTIGYILSALGLVAGLAWNDAIRSVIEKVFPFGSANGILVQFAYAAAITTLVIVISTRLIRWSGKEE